MSAGSSLPYRLRPNKAVDRELFLSLLMRLAPKMGLNKYHYIGLGGPFLEDFRLLHSRIGIGCKRRGRTVGRLTCVEDKVEVHKRQRFNRPVPSIKCIHSTLENYLDQTTFTTPAIIWFDYTEPSGLASKIQRFAATIGSVPVGSVLRITLNAHPDSFQQPPAAKDLSVDVDGEISADRTQKPTIHEWRLDRFKECFGTHVPSGLTVEGMTFKKYGPTLLQVLKLAVEKQVLNFTDRHIVWALATHYADGQAMVTAALVVCAREDAVIEKLINGWEFHATPDNPHRLDLPALSSLERLTMESYRNARRKLGFDLSKVSEPKLGDDPFEMFNRFYRLYPHFSRVEL